MTAIGSDVVRRAGGLRSPGRTTCRKHKRPLRETKDGKLLCPICENPWESRVWEMVHKDNRNALIVVEGPPGTGKSYFCLKVAQDLDHRFYENPAITIEMLGFRILFRPARFARILGESNLYTGAVIIIEEGGVQADHRKWFTFNNMVFNYILEVFRFMRLIVIVNVPVIQFMDSDAQKMFNYHVETVKVEYKEKLNVVKIKEQSYNSTTKKIYRKFLRFKVNKRWIAFKLPWKFQGPSKTIVRVYEKLHREFKSGLIEDLAKEMQMIDKQESMKKKKILINEDDAVAQIIANPARYVKIVRNRKMVSAPLIESDFNVGRGISARIKSRAEMELNEPD